MRHKKAEEKHVVIIGAGVAGLYAAHSLLKAYHDNGMNNTFPLHVTIVEASNYIGGRIKSCSNFIGNGHKIDLGAEFVHGSNTALTKFIQDHVLPKDNGSSSNNSYVEPIFITSQGDGGPDQEPTCNGMYGGYYLGKENMLLPYNSDDADFIKLNESLWEMFEEDTIEAGKKEKKLHGNLDDSTVQPDYPDDPNISLGDYLQSKHVSQRMIGLALAGYANTAGCWDLSSISYAASRSFEQYWKTHEEEGDVRLHSNLSMSAVIDALVKNIQNYDSKTSKTMNKEEYDNDGEIIKFRHNQNKKRHRCYAKIILEWKVKSIQYSSCDEVKSSNNSKSIIIESEHGLKFFADSCILSVPISIFNNKLIKFQPQLPKQKMKAFEMVGMDRAIKILLKFNKKVWPHKLQSIICADCPIPEIWFREFQLHEDDKELDEGQACSHCHYVAVCYLMSKAADDLMQHGEHEAIEIAKSQLQRIFQISSEDMNQAFLSFLIFDWGKHDTIRGGYGYPKVGIKPKHYMNIASNVNRELFFCGEGTHLGAGMTVQAAMETGARAAREVMESFSSSV